MRMLFAAAAAISICLPTVATAQDAPVLIEARGPDVWDVDAAYRKNNELRVMVKLGPNRSALEARELALRQMALMAQQKGFERFAVIKLSNCGTMRLTQNGMPISGALHHQCRLLGQMLSGDEAPRRIGQYEIKVFSVEEALGRQGALAHTTPYEMLVRALMTQRSEAAPKPGDDASPMPSVPEATIAASETGTDPLAEPMR